MSLNFTAVCLIPDRIPHGFAHTVKAAGFSCGPHPLKDPTTEVGHHYGHVGHSLATVAFPLGPPST